MMPSSEPQAEIGQRALSPNRSLRWLGLLNIPLLLLLLGCANRGVATPTIDAGAAVPTGTSSRPAVPLAATFTPLPSFGVEAAPIGTRGSSSDLPERETATPVSFDEIVVDLHYVVPALGLDRRLKGDMANRITIDDELTGRETEYRNQGGVLLELRQALPKADLEDIPGGCTRCVFVEYALSIEDEAAAGWLKDVVLLASIENYLAVALGPHFPPGTIVGLRRSASPYAPAHTIALAEGGQLWKWLATDSEIPEPTVSISDTVGLQQLAEELSDIDLQEHYVTPCEGSPVETLFIDAGGGARSTSIVCPEFSLPARLLPLYLQLDGEVQSVIADASVPRPPAAFPLAAVLDYKRADGRRLTLYIDGRAVALDVDASSYSRTLTTTQLLSITTSLLDSGELQPGLNTFAVEPAESITSTSAAPAATLQPSSVVVLRGPDGFYDAKWSGNPGLSALGALNALLDELVGIIPPPVEAADGTPTPLAGETPVSESTGVATVPSSPSSTATATPTPRP